MPEYIQKMTSVDTGHRIGFKLRVRAWFEYSLWFEFNVSVWVWIRSGMGAYAGAARRRVHLATVLIRPPSDHRPGRRQTRQAHILQIGLRLAIAQTDARPDPQGAQSYVSVHFLRQPPMYWSIPFRRRRQKVKYS